MINLDLIVKGAKNLAKAAVLAGSLYFSACESPVEPLKPKQPTNPLISLTAELVNDVDIKYTVRFKNLKEPRVNILKNGSQILSRTLSENDTVYSETLSYQTNNAITKGNYDAVLNGKTLSGRDTSITASVNVPNYNPESNFLGLQAEMDEGKEINVSLEGRLSDKNPEDNPVSLISAVSTDGKTQATFSGKNINIKSLPDKVGNYSVRVEIGSDYGGKSAQTLIGTIWDLLDVQGFLEDNERDLRQPGIVKIYDENNTKLGEISVNSSGQFTKRIERRILNLTSYILIQGRKIEPSTGENKSYIRTIKLPRGDVKNLVVRVVPYDGLAENQVSVEDFSRHVREVLNRGPPTKQLGIDALTLNPEIYKWDFGENPNARYKFREIIISKSKRPDDASQAFFSQEAAEHIKSRILDQSDIGVWFDGKISNPNQIKIVESYDSISGLDYGRIFVYPSNGNYAFMLNDVLSAILGIIWASVNSNGSLTEKRGIAHEFGHASGLMGHAETLSQEKTIMTLYNINDIRGPPWPIDVKTAKAIYENTYQHGQGRNDDGLLRVNDFLGLKFLDE